MSNATKGFETLGRLAVMNGDSRLFNRIDDKMSRAQFHAYMNGVDSARTQVLAYIEALDALFDGSQTINIKGTR